MFLNQASPPKYRYDNIFVSYNLNQNWPFQDTIVNYITQNPSSPKAYQKLVESCKYFFVKNPILVVERLRFDDFGNVWDVFLNDVTKEISFANLSSRIWITSLFKNFWEISSNNKDKKVVSSIIPYFYRVDVTTVLLCNQNISLKEFEFLSTNVEKIALRLTVVRNEEDTIVPLENLIAMLPKLKEMGFTDVSDSTSITSNTVKKLLKIPHFLCMKYVEFRDLPDNFDIETFFIYAKTNKHTKFELNFDDSIPKAYKNRLENIIDEIIETFFFEDKLIGTEEYKYRPPFICYNDMDTHKQSKMVKICFSNASN